MTTQINRSGGTDASATGAIVRSPLQQPLDSTLAPSPPPQMALEKVFVRDLEDGHAFDSVFLVRERALRQKKNGEDFLRLVLADCTGTVPAVCWDDARQAHDVAEPGAVVRARGRFGVSERYGGQLTVQSLVAAKSGDYELTDLLDGPVMSADQMEADVRQLIATVQNLHLRRLLDALFGKSSEVWQRFRGAPAAKFYHQAYGHGLL